MSKKLVAYFSQSGITKALAEKMAEKAGANLFEIAPEKPYSDADVNWRNPVSRCNKEKIGKKDVPLAQKVENIEEYDKIYIGFPIWYWNAPNVVQTFIKEHDFSNKTIVLFATSGGSDLGKTAQTVEKLVDSSCKVVNGLLINNLEDDKIDTVINM